MYMAFLAYAGKHSQIILSGCLLEEQTRHTAIQFLSDPQLTSEWS